MKILTIILSFLIMGTCFASGIDMRFIGNVSLLVGQIAAFIAIIYFSWRRYKQFKINPEYLQNINNQQRKIYKPQTNTNNASNCSQDAAHRHDNYGYNPVGGLPMSSPTHDIAGNTYGSSSSPSINPSTGMPNY